VAKNWRAFSASAGGSGQLVGSVNPHHGGGPLADPDARGGDAVAAALAA
jgi:hypothetical protein